MRTLITLTLLLSASLVNAQIVYEFDAQSTADNSLKGNHWGVTAEGTVTLDQGAQTITVNIFNTANSGNISGFDFYDPNSASNTASTDWNLVSATTTGAGFSYLNWWGETSEVRWLGDGSYTGGVSGKYVGAEANWNGAAWPFINATNPNQDMTFVFQWEGGGSYNMTDLENAWDAGDADLRLRFQNIHNQSSGSAWYYDKFSTDLTRSVPEPSTYGMFGAGALILMILVRRFKK